MEFHQKAGPNARFSDDKRSARRAGSNQDYKGAIVFSSQPLEDDSIFEVKLEEKATTAPSNYFAGLMFGVTLQRPDLIDSPPEFLNGLEQSWIFYAGNAYYVTSQGRTHQATPFGNFKELNVGDRVGVMRKKSTGALHVYVNGEEKGSAFSGIPSGCYAALDLIGQCVAVSIVGQQAKTADVQFGLISIDIASWEIPALKHRLSAVADSLEAASVKTTHNTTLKTEGDLFVSSDRFKHKALPGFEWFLKVYPKGYSNEESSSYVSVALCVEKSGKKSSATAPSAFFSASFTSAKGESTLPMSPSLTSFVDKAVCVIENFATREKVEKMCADDGSITLSGKIFIELPFSHHAETLRRCYESGEFSDFKIRVDDEPFEIAVHKAILSESSPVFMRMLHSPCDDVKKGKVTIKESSIDAVKAMLQFIYADPLCFDGLQELSIDVLKLADQYDLPDLKELCEKALVGMLSKANVLQFAHIADLCIANDLKKAAFQLIYDNDGFLSEDDWIEFQADKERSTLVIEILNFIVAKQAFALAKK